MKYSKRLKAATLLPFILFGVSCLSGSNIDVDLSLRLASSESRAQIAPHIKEIWIYLVPRDVDPRTPVDFSKVKPNVVLKNYDLKRFLALLEGSGDRGEKLGEKNVTPHSYGCYVFCQPEFATNPAYLSCDIFADGRAYMSFYTGLDSAGKFNMKLGAFLEEHTKGSTNGSSRNDSEPVK